MRCAAPYAGPPMFAAIFPALPAPSADAPTTIKVAKAQAARECPTRPICVSSGDSAAATAPPTKAEITPINAHQAKAGQPTAAGAELTVGTSTTSKPTPRPSNVKSSCKIRHVRTPANTADHVQVTEKIEVVRGAIRASYKQPTHQRRRLAPVPEP